VQKKVVSPNDFTSTGQLSATLLAFIGRYNAGAAPFSWKYTAADLDRYLARLDVSNSAEAYVELGEDSHRRNGHAPSALAA
jgi:hypothetical protein